MSHAMVVVLIPEPTNVERLVAEAMEPYSEHTSRGGWWDWWQIGGRYTGIWSDYDPREDPANHEQCGLCGGTGIRDDVVGREHRAKNPDYGCNGCGYGWSSATPGTALKWPTRWCRSEGDIVSVKLLLEHEDWPKPFAFVAPGVGSERESWDGEEFQPIEDFDALYRGALEAHPDMFAVVVDYHS